MNHNDEISCYHPPESSPCPQCEAKRQGETKRYYAKLLHEWLSRTTQVKDFATARSMRLDTQPGDKVRFCFLTSGYETEVFDALDHLKPGHVYTVRDLDVGQSSSRVYLNEVPGRGFNAVLFANVEPGAAYHAAAEKIRQCVEGIKQAERGRGFGGCPFVIPADLIEDLLDAHKKAGGA